MHKDKDLEMKIQILVIAINFIKKSLRHTIEFFSNMNVQHYYNENHDLFLTQRHADFQTVK